MVKFQIWFHGHQVKGISEEKNTWEFGQALYKILDNSDRCVTNTDPKCHVLSSDGCLGFLKDEEEI
jgi:hypothetical protein